MKRYNAWNLYEKMNFHHEHMRGQVYEPSRGSSCTKVLDHCFDCSVLWETISTYAAKNNADAHSLLDNLIKYQVYTPPGFGWKKDANRVESKQSELSHRWFDVLWACERGHLMEAVAALEFEGDARESDADWDKIA